MSNNLHLLESEIAELKGQLSAYSKEEEYSSLELVELSQKLDVKIIEYMKIVKTS